MKLNFLLLFTSIGELNQVLLLKFELYDFKPSIGQINWFDEIIYQQKRKHEKY